MLPTYVRAVFGDMGFVELNKSDNDDFLLNVNILVNISEMTEDYYAEKKEFIENNFIYDESRHPLSVLMAVNVNFKTIGEFYR